MDPILNKVVFITGGAGGIGLEMVKNLLKNNAKGVAIIDISPEAGEKAVKEIEKTFGSNKVVFIQTDITNPAELEAAYEKTIQVFGNLDIVVNNAGIVNECDCRKTIAVNLVAPIESSLLAIDKYFNHRSGDEALIVNTSSVLGICSFQSAPFYTTSKHGLIGFNRSIGGDVFYKHYKVRVLTLCPGYTDTNMTSRVTTALRFPEYREIEVASINKINQSPERVGEGLIDVIRKGKTGSVWICEDNLPVYEIKFPSKEEMKV